MCTTELGTLAKMQDEFTKRNCKIMALSCDNVESHKGWIEDIKGTQSCAKFDYPIIADTDRSLAVKWGMVDPDEKDGTGMPLTCRAVFIIGPDKKLKLSILYPATTGRNFAEVLRVLDSLQLTLEHSVATPANWQDGGDCMVVPSLSDDQAKDKFPKVSSPRAVLETLSCFVIAHVPPCERRIRCPRHVGHGRFYRRAVVQPHHPCVSSHDSVLSTRPHTTGLQKDRRPLWQELPSRHPPAQQVEPCLVECCCIISWPAKPTLSLFSSPSPDVVGGEPLSPEPVHVSQKPLIGFNHLITQRLYRNRGSSSPSWHGPAYFPTRRLFAPHTSFASPGTVSRFSVQIE